MPVVHQGKSDRVGALIDPLPVAAPSLTDDTPARSTIISVEVDGGTINPNARSHSLKPVQTLTEGSSTAPTPGTSTSTLDLQIPEGKVTLIHNASNIISSLAIETRLGLNFGTQTITASPKSDNIFDSGQTLSAGWENSSAKPEVQSFSDKTTPINGPSISTVDAKSTGPPAPNIGSPTIKSNDQDPYIPVSRETHFLGLINTLASGISTTIPSLQTPFVSSSSTSQIFSATAAPALPEIPTAPTDGGNAVTANTAAHLHINNHTSTPGGAFTVSGTMISLTPDQSDVVGTHTGSLGANFTGGLASGPKATSLQTFTGDAPGAREELCSSSMLILVSIALQLWLR